MGKSLLYMAVLASSSFLLTQLIAMYYFDFSPPQSILAKFRGQTHLLTNVKLLQSLCTRSSLHCILVDKHLLQKFRSHEIEHRQTGAHDHQSCNFFCNIYGTTFLIKGIDFHNNNEFFVKSLVDAGFTVVVDENFDKREESLEHRHGKYKLKYHLFLEKNGAFIHVVIVYPRLNREWSNECKLTLVRNWFHYLDTSQYCTHENIFKKIDYAKAVIDGVNIYIPKYLSLFLEELQSTKFIPCNYNQARSFYSTYGMDTTHESDMFKSKANHILSLVIEILSTLNVRFWLSSGTCLGWYRQCDFISHSKDVDIGIWIKDYNQHIIEAFSEKGLHLKHLFGKLEDSFELSFSMDDLKLDIFFFYEEDNIMWNGGTQVRTGKKFKYIFQKFKLCWTTLHNLLVRIPCKTNKYILANYGENWNKLIKSWDWKASPPNVHENGEWPEEEREKVIQLF
ncbi:ribitol-5-phosphate transferase FKTN-like isoform X1 [Hydractinia symbiolongicarpus]|uniref:ribitol-5-phosphate transferase FKTN-like isoform X1 n=1 Tax=Hydractinia symbiolongicarpus TaxID=13093 RepID=UPI002550CE02|nr:ribitol-5-phosphate transferase FKTN-like isoform X1 [Hydractinia symbiolongicarpus]